MKSKFETLHTGLIFTVIVFAISACGSTKLLDIDKTSKKLSFTETQFETLQPKIEQIEKIVEDYNLAKETLGSVDIW